MIKNSTSQKLYEKTKTYPIYDYHCHLSPREIYEDKPFKNITEIILNNDHYKWRAMRIAGVDEKNITGNADDFSKFLAWANTLERLVGSPLFSFSMLEFNQFFDIDEPLTKINAVEFYDRCNNFILKNKISPSYFIKKANVRLICTTDDPDDDLKYHIALAKENKNCYKVLPTFRPDRLLKNPDNISKEELLLHLEKRLDFFSKNGCVLADHSIENFDFDDEILVSLANMYAKRGIAMQLHIGALRNINSKMHAKIGVDTGFDIMNDFSLAVPLSKLLDKIYKTTDVKIILYSLNCKDNAVLSALMGSFKNVKFGTAWWFNDNKDGIQQQLKYTANAGGLADFLGMLTDSRSFLSYARHDYFRRILCGFVGDLVDSGEFVSSDIILNEIIEDICYRNIRKFLELEF